MILANMMQVNEKTAVLFVYIRKSGYFCSEIRKVSTITKKLMKEF